MTSSSGGGGQAPDLCPGLLHRDMMVEADDPCDFPPPIFVPPQVNESALASRVVRFWMIKTVDADLHCAVTLDAMNLERAGDEVSPHVSAADVFLNALCEFILA